MHTARFTAAAVVALTLHAQAQSLYGIRYTTGELVRIDAQTGTVGVIGSTGITQPGGLDRGADGSLYTVSVDAAPSLYRIDATTAASTAIGNLGVGFQFEGGLAIVDASTGYFVGGRNDAAGAALFRLDLATGAATEIGGTGVADINALTVRADGALVGYSQFEGFFTIDASTASISLIGPQAGGFANIGGLATFDGQTGHLVSQVNTGPKNGVGLFSVDLFSGTVGSVVDLRDPISGLAIPSPSGVSILALAGLGAARRRR